MDQQLHLNFQHPVQAVQGRLGPHVEPLQHPVYTTYVVSGAARAIIVLFTCLKPQKLAMSRPTNNMALEPGIMSKVMFGNK